MTGQTRTTSSHHGGHHLEPQASPRFPSGPQSSEHRVPGPQSQGPQHRHHPGAHGRCGRRKQLPECHCMYVTKVLAPCLPGHHSCTHPCSDLPVLRASKRMLPHEPHRERGQQAEPQRGCTRNYPTQRGAHGFCGLCPPGRHTSKPRQQPSQQAGGRCWRCTPSTARQTAVPDQTDGWIRQDKNLKQKIIIIIIMSLDW